MNKKPKITIIVPVYNVENYLPKCLDSLINQTIKDLEIICINDGSTDKSLNILKEYAQNDNRIIVIDKENEGQGICRNYGIKIAKGEYTAFVDPDDWVNPSMYENMYNQARSLNSEIVISNYVRYIEETERYTFTPFFKQAVSAVKEKVIEITPFKNIDKSIINKTLLISPCYCWNRIYNTNFLKLNDIKFDKTRRWQDCLFILKSHILAKNISYIPKNFYFYRIRKDISSKNFDGRYEDMFEVIKNFDSLLKDFNLQHEFKDNMKYFITMNIYWLYNKVSKITQQKIIKRCNSDEIITKYTKHLSFKVSCYSKMLKTANKIFYITNNQTHKVINLAGVRFKFKLSKNRRKKKEENYKQLLLSFNSEK